MLEGQRGLDSLCYCTYCETIQIYCNSTSFWCSFLHQLSCPIICPCNLVFNYSFQCQTQCIKQACVKKNCGGYINVLLCCSHLSVCSNSLSIASYCPTKSLHHFYSEERTGNLFSSSGMYSHHYKCKSNIWFQYVACYFCPENRNRKHCFHDNAFCFYKCVVALCIAGQVPSSRTTSLNACVIKLSF